MRVTLGGQFAAELGGQFERNLHCTAFPRIPNYSSRAALPPLH